MPYLRDITYSREATIAAVRDYLQFISKMYLDEALIIEPPATGWLEVTAENLRPITKTPEVIALLRQLPYTRRLDGENVSANCAARTSFMDWSEIARQLTGKGLSRAARLNVKSQSEGGEHYAAVPASVIGLVDPDGDNDERWLLDTRRGIIYWLECPEEIGDSPPLEPVLDDAWSYAREAEIDWRADSVAWSIPDFFEVLKEQFRRLNFYPVDQDHVEDVWDPTNSDSDAEFRRRVRETFTAHGWPDMQTYRKQECLTALNELRAEFDR